MPDLPLPALLTITAAAQRLRISRYYVLKMIAAGDLAGVTVAGRLLVTEASVSAAQSAIARQLDHAAAVA